MSGIKGRPKEYRGKPMYNPKLKQRTVVIEEITRLINSKNGNPRFYIRWVNTEQQEQGEGGRWERGGGNTKADASWNYDVNEVGFKPGCTVRIWTNKQDTIVGMERIES